MQRSPRKRLAYLLLTGTVLVWGVTFVLVKNALADCSPLLFNTIRMGLATLALLAAHLRTLRRISRRELAAGALAGLFLAAGYHLQTLGLDRTSPAKSAFITGMVVIFVPALTLLPTLRPRHTGKPGWAAAVGATISLCGLFLITTPAHTTLNTLFSSIGLGDFLTLGCALAFAAHLLTLAHFARSMSAGLLATLQIGSCTLFMLMTLPAEHLRITLSGPLLLAFLICSLLATAAAFTVQSFVQQILPPTHTVMLLALEPVFAYAVSVFVLHDSLGTRALLGAGLLLLAILATEFSPQPGLPVVTEIPA